MSFSSLAISIGRPIYAGCDAISRVQDLDQCGGVDVITQLPLRILRIVKKYYDEQDLPTPVLTQSVSYLDGIKTMVTAFVNVPKSWHDLMETMSKVPATWPELKQIVMANKTRAAAEGLRGIAYATAATGKTIGIIEFLGRLGCQLYLQISVQVGGSQVFCSDSLGKLKGIKGKLTYFTSSARILVNIYDAVVLSRKNLEVEARIINAKHGAGTDKAREALDKATKDKQYAVQNCFFRCSIECTKMFFAYSGSSTTRAVLGTGLVFIVINMTGSIFWIYYYQGKSVKYPDWLKKPGE